MFAWWIILFALGTISFIDTFLVVGDTFRQVTAAVFLLASMGLLARITRKSRSGEKERLNARIAALERELMTARMSARHDERVPTASGNVAVGA